MTEHVINIASEFSRHPAGRYKTDGEFSGEVCRKKILVPALKRPERVIIELDGTRGYGSSFLEEAFGGLVREESFSETDLKNKIVFRSADPSLPEEIWGYVADAQSEQPKR